MRLIRPHARAALLLLACGVLRSVHADEGFSRLHCPGGTCYLRPAAREPLLVGRAAGLQSPWLRLQSFRPALELRDALQLRGGGGASTLASLKTPIAFLGWYLMSIVYSIVNKEVLSQPASQP